MNETTLSDLIAHLIRLRDSAPGAGDLRVVYSLAHLDVETVRIARPEGHSGYVVVVS